MSENAELPTETIVKKPSPVQPVVIANKPNRLYQAAAWVAIVAGSVFIVAVIFFSGFALGKHAGPGYWGGHHREQFEMNDRGGPEMMPGGPGPGMWGPGGGPGSRGGPGGPGSFGPGPGNFGPGQQGPGQSSPPTAPPRA